MVEDSFEINTSIKEETEIDVWAGTFLLKSGCIFVIKVACVYTTKPGRTLKTGKEMEHYNSDFICKDESKLWRMRLISPEWCMVYHSNKVAIHSKDSKISKILLLAQSIEAIIVHFAFCCNKVI